MDFLSTVKFLIFEIPPLVFEDFMGEWKFCDTPYYSYYFSFSFRITAPKKLLDR